MYGMNPNYTIVTREQHQADIDGDIQQPRHTAGRGTDHFRTERIVVAFELRSGE